jgi:pimeloyl-ACP methyl ester carboxylesterase
MLWRWTTLDDGSFGRFVQRRQLRLSLRSATRASHASCRNSFAAYRGSSMKLAAKWRSLRTIDPNGVEQGRIETIRLGSQWFDVVRLGQGVPVLLVPGLAGSWKLLVPLARLLARHFDVIVPGLRGDRFPWELDSQPKRVADLGAYVRDLDLLMDRLGLESPVVCGVSFGGAVALEFAVKYPHRLGALILNGVEARFHPSIGSTIARRTLERFPLPRDNPFINQFFHLLYGAKPQPGPLVDFVVDRIWETDQSVMAERLNQLESFDATDRLWRIEVPTLVLAGARDVIVPVARQRALSEGITGSRFQTIPNAGHVGFLTHRAEVVRAIRRHIGGLAATV